MASLFHRPGNKNDSRSFFTFQWHLTDLCDQRVQALLYDVCVGAGGGLYAFARYCPSPRGARGDHAGGIPGFTAPVQAKVPRAAAGRV